MAGYEFIREPYFSDNFEKFKHSLLKEPKMAGITKIGRHEVTEIKRDAAQVGCTKVTRAEVEELLKKMDSAPAYSDFTIEREGSGSDFINFSIRRQESGFVSVSENVNNPYFGNNFLARSAHLCLNKKNAQKLFEYLGGELGHSSYFEDGRNYRVLFKKV